MNEDRTLYRIESKNRRVCYIKNKDVNITGRNIVSNRILILERSVQDCYSRELDIKRKHRDDIELKKDIIRWKSGYF